jgi:hypothetical protein
MATLSDTERQVLSIAAPLLERLAEYPGPQAAPPEPDAP